MIAHSDTCYYITNIFFIDGRAKVINDTLEEDNNDNGDNEEDNKLVYIDKAKFDLCKHCKDYNLKHERSSHCSRCYYCVLRRDHHCDWIGKCIGFNNISMFVRFCIWFAVCNSFIKVR